MEKSNFVVKSCKICGYYGFARSYKNNLILCNMCFDKEMEIEKQNEILKCEKDLQEAIETLTMYPEKQVEILAAIALNYKVNFQKYLKSCRETKVSPTTPS